MLRNCPWIWPLLVCLAACGTPEVERARAIGEAFVGPATLPIRNDLSVRSNVLGTAKHGERVEILQTRRRFTKVRAGAVEGWVDGRNLLSTEQMNEILRSRQTGAKLPSQGRATVYDPLNIHSDPNRQSPSIAQVPAGGAVEVVGHKVTPRVAAQPATPLLRTQPKSVARKDRRKDKKKEEPAPKVPLPPMPAAPAVPQNWIALSKSTVPEDEAKPVPKDDWSLVRTTDGKVGWALTRMLTMAIPDAVAQYAEGHRITSYFSLGDVNDDGQTKHHWLWTTLSHPLEPYEFDSFRVFIYNVKRHRYETAYIERNVKGYYPITTEAGVQITEGKKQITVPGFSVVVEDKDRNLLKKTYSFQLYRVRMIERVPYERPEDKAPASAPVAPADAKKNVASWWRRLLNK